MKCVALSLLFLAWFRTGFGEDTFYFTFNEFPIFWSEAFHSSCFTFYFAKLFSFSFCVCVWEQEGWEFSRGVGGEGSWTTKPQTPKTSDSSFSLSLLKHYCITVQMEKGSPFGKDSRPHWLENLRDSKNNNNKGVPFLFGPCTAVRGTATVVVVDVVTVDTPIYDLFRVQSFRI